MYEACIGAAQARNAGLHSFHATPSQSKPSIGRQTALAIEARLSLSHCMSLLVCFYRCLFCHTASLVQCEKARLHVRGGDWMERVAIQRHWWFITHSNDKETSWGVHGVASSILKWLYVHLSHLTRSLRHDLEYIACWWQTHHVGWNHNARELRPHQVLFS